MAVKKKKKKATKKKATKKKKTTTRKKAKKKPAKKKSTGKKKAFGGYTISFKGCTDSVEKVFGSKPLTPSDMTKALWKYIKRKKLAGK